MMYNEFLQKTGLQLALNDGMCTGKQLADWYYTKIQPLYMISDFNCSIDFCRYYKKYGYEKTYNHVLRAFKRNTQVMLDNIANCSGGYRIQVYNPDMNRSFEKTYFFYTKKQARDKIKLDYFITCLNDYIE